MNPTPHEGATQTKPRPQEPVVVQIDPKCLHSALKEFFEPLKSNDPRADFFSVYRRESEEFDRDYARKYDEDLNTSLIFAGLFSAVSSAFIIDVQSKLEPDPNQMTAAYMQILIHAVNGSLFPDANPGTITWTGPPPEIVAVQSLLYASLATSLFAAFLAMLGKQWVNRYLRNRGGSAADKSRDRQRKLDGLQKWHFYIAIESLPVMLQFALLLLACALSQYLWTISRTIAGVIIAVTVLGVTLYVFLTLAATLYYNCPYQTPPSTLTRAALRYLTRSDATLAGWLRSLVGSFPSIKVPGRILGRLRPGVQGMVRSFRCAPAVGEETEHIPLVVVATPPDRVFMDIPIDLEVCEADARCIYWVLDSTTDIDVIFSTVRFAADTIWYPEIARVLSPHILADLFCDCLLDGEVIPGKSEYASSIGMALASVLSVRLSTEPEDESLRGLCERLLSRVQWKFSPKPTFEVVLAALTDVASVSSQDRSLLTSSFLHIGPDCPPAVHKLWLSRVILQTIWRRRRVQGPIGIFSSHEVGLIGRSFATDGDRMPDIVKTNLFLALTISLGLLIDFRDLYAPNNRDAPKAAIRLFDRQLRLLIVEGKAGWDDLIQALYALIPFDPFETMDSGDLGFLWITEILNSGYQENERQWLADEVVELLGKYFHQVPDILIGKQSAWIPPLLGFLSLSEKLETKNSTRFIALRILAISPPSPDFGSMILPILASSLLPTHPLQARRLALNIFLRFMPGWFSPQMENVPSEDLDQFIQAVGDPFQFPDLPLQDGKRVDVPYDDPMKVMAALIEFGLSDLWRDHLRRSNFTSFEEMVSTWDGKRTALRFIIEARLLLAPLSTATKISVVIRRLEELRCLNTVEVVIMWAWTVGTMNPVDHNGWKLIGRDTLRFYQTHGVERLADLKKHITIRVGPPGMLLVPYCQYATRSFYELPVLKQLPVTVSRLDTYLYLSQACQLRRLYHLFGYDPTTWREAVGVKEVGEKMDVLSGHSVALVPSMGWACDYP